MTRLDSLLFRLDLDFISAGLGLGPHCGASSPMWLCETLMVKKVRKIQSLKIYWMFYNLYCYESKISVVGNKTAVPE